MENRAYSANGGASEPGLTFAQRLKSGASTAIGAVAALGVLFAMGVWFYRLGDRDARSVPIIRAELGPTKVIPKDPGGEKTPHQNIKSYDASTGGTATAGAAVIATAPPDPKPEDVAMGTLAPPSKPETVAEDKGAIKTAAKPDPAPETAVTAPERKIETGDVKPAPEAEETRVAAAPDAATTAPERPTIADLATTDATDETTTTETTVPDEVLVIPGATALAPDASPFAPRRPGNLVARNSAAAEEAVTDERDLNAEAAASRIQIQLSADQSEAAVKKSWARIFKKHQDLLQGRALAIQTTISGGKTFYRLRVGPFNSRAEAASVCQALKARRQDCIVARNS